LTYNVRSCVAEHVKYALNIHTFALAELHIKEQDKRKMLSS